MLYFNSTNSKFALSSVFGLRTFILLKTISIQFAVEPKSIYSLLTLKNAENMESENRNSLGRFVSGHKGSKPKGAINKNTRDYLAILDKISDLLEEDLIDNIRSFNKKEKVRLWYATKTLKHIKLSKFTEPDPQKEEITKIIFEIVDSLGRPFVHPDDRPATATPAVSGPLPPSQAPPANAPIQYGAFDEGRIRKSGSFRSFRR